jgi:hypothetical protein
VVIWSLLVAGALAVLMARTPLVRGSLAVVVGVPSLFMVTQDDSYVFVPAILIAAGLTELVGRRLAVPQAAALASTALITGWVLTLVLTRDVAWSRELLTGSIGSAAAAGYLAGWAVANGGVRRTDDAAVTSPA